MQALMLVSDEPKFESQMIVEAKKYLKQSLEN